MAAKALKKSAQPPVLDARQSLLLAAADLFARQGFSATGVQQITDAAGVNKAMLYYYFDSKDNLYNQLIDEGINAVEQAVSAAEQTDLTIKERLSCFLTSYLTVVIERPHLARILFREGIGGGEQARQTVIDHFSGSIRRVAEVLAAAQRDGTLKGSDSLLSAYSLFGMATMFITSHFVAQRPLDVPELVSHMVALFLHGTAR